MEENKKEFGKDQVEQIIKMFGERRMNRFGCISPHSAMTVASAGT